MIFKWKINVYLLVHLGCLFYSCHGKLFELEVLERAPVCEVEDRFLSIALGMNIARNDFKGIDFSSQKLKTLLTALKPAYLRLGGSSANFLFFKVGSTKPSSSPSFPDQEGNITQLAASHPTPQPTTIALPTTNVVTTQSPLIASPSPAPTAPSKNGPLKATPFTPRIPERPTTQQGNQIGDPQAPTGPISNGQNQGNMNPSNQDQNSNSQNENQDQNQNQMGQGQPQTPGPINPKKPKKQPGTNTADQQYPGNGPLFVTVKGEDPKNPSDALNEYDTDGEGKLDLKNNVASLEDGSGSGSDLPGSGDGMTGSGTLHAETENKIYKRSTVKRSQASQPFWLMSDDFDKFYNFFNDVGLDVIFNLGNFVRYGNGSWNATNALDMLHHIAYRGYKLGWQLGNDPDRYRKYGPNRIVNATQAGNDSAQLRKILRSDNQFGTLLVGPDVTLPRKGTYAEKYLREYLKTNASSEVSAVAWHQYYVNGRATSENEMVSPSTLDLFKDQIKKVKSLLKETNTNKPIWLTETGSASNGGAAGLSDTFLASFLYLDKLGVAGVFCNSVVMRQSLLKGNYALLDEDYTPRPDYWLALLHKRLVGKRVLLVSGDSKTLRAYAHCTRDSAVYKPGSVTVFVINLRAKPARIKLGKSFKGKKIDQFLVTSSDGSLTTKSIMLNGEKLEMRSNTTLPSLSALGVKQPMKMPSYSYAFYVISDAGVENCK